MYIKYTCNKNVYIHIMYTSVNNKSNILHKNSQNAEEKIRK